jgi:hypothetical protein
MADPNPNSRDVEHASHKFHHARPQGIDPLTSGQPKHATGSAANVRPHGGMVSKTHYGALVTGGGDLKSALAAGSVGPNIGDMLAPPPKTLAPVAIVFGQRSRTSNHTTEVHAALGKAILAAAVHNGGPHEDRVVPAKEKR